MMTKTAAGRIGITTTVLTVFVAIYFYWSPFYWGLFYADGDPVPWAAQCVAGFFMTVLSIIAIVIVCFCVFCITQALWGGLTWMLKGEPTWWFGLE